MKKIIKKQNKSKSFSNANNSILNKKRIVAKAAWAAFVPILTFVLLEILEYQLNMFGIIICGSGVLFTIPFYVTANEIKKNPSGKALWYFLIDIVNVTSVGIFTSLICDIINMVRFGINEFSGITTALLSLIYLLINISFVAVNKILLKRANKN